MSRTWRDLSFFAKVERQGGLQAAAGPGRWGRSNGGYQRVLAQLRRPSVFFAVIAVVGFKRRGALAPALRVQIQALQDR